MDATSIWGLDTFETHEKILKKTNPKTEIVCIGPAGEKLVKYAIIATGGKNVTRIAGRAGCGTVMGTKNLKAVAVYGTQKINVFDQYGFNQFNKSHAKTMVEETRPIKEYGTSGEIIHLVEIGNLPIKNWKSGKFNQAEKISGQRLAETILRKKYYCGKCVIGCGRLIEINEKEYDTNGIIRGPEYETIGMLGTNLLIDSLKTISELNEICNRYGMDTITTGSIIGFIIECYENNLIQKEEIDGIDLKWGDKNAIRNVLIKIGKREGIGKLLGEGIRYVSNIIGPDSKQYAMEVKGLDIPAHDPRCKMGLGLGYATANRGACHLEAFTLDFKGGASLEDMGYSETLNRLDIEVKPEFVIKFQNLMCVFDSIKCCKFIIFGGIALTQLAETLNLVTGSNISKEELLKTGERIFNLKRLYNNKCGITKKDDVLPKRFLTLKREDGNFRDKLPPLDEMLKEYYRQRGWDETGIPTSEKINELDLSDFT